MEEVNGKLWKSAQSIPGVKIVLDEEAKRFGAQTSGHLYAYDTGGGLAFTGGITGARGHPGDNPGLLAATLFVNSGQTPLQPVEVAVKSDGETVFISVRDHGMGIAKENQTKIFQQFERISTSSHLPGLGLGLYISKNIVEQHGEKIGVESEPGEGSVFRVELPVHFAQPIEIEAQGPVQKFNEALRTLS